MGNQLKKEYDVNLEEQCGSGGLGLRWKLFHATDLKSKQEVTIFTFSKKEIPKALRKDGDRYINLLKKEVERGYKFKHPNCLRVIKPIKEFRGEIAFVTERVMCSLANILGDTILDTENAPAFQLPPHIANFKFGALQLRSGLAQLCDAAQFMHNDAHMVHGNIDPSSVYITKRGDWKLFGFAFAEHVATHADEARLDWDFTNVKELDYYPSFTCLAPEMMISSIMTVKSDVFAIGRICYILHRQQAGIRNERRMQTADEYRRYVNELNIGLNHLNQGGIPLQGIPEPLVETLKCALKADEKLRCNVQDITNCKYLNDMIVRVIRYLERLLEKEEEGKIKFLKKLPEVVAMFDEQSLIHKVIPPLMVQIKDERMTRYIMPALLKITAQLKPEQFQTLIAPILCRYYASKDLPQVFYMLVDNIVLLCSKSSADSRRDHLVPMILTALGVRNVMIQTNVLKNIPEIVEKQYVEWRELNSRILPKLRDICNLSVGQNNKITPLRVNVLMCLAKIFPKFDTDTITQIILKECAWKILEKTKETAILMSVLGLADAIAKHGSAHLVANHILPRLMPLLMEGNLSLKQYGTYVSCVRYMIDKIDRYRTNQINRAMNGADAKDSSKSLVDPRAVNDSMHDILDQEFDPQKKGALHKQSDDPFLRKDDTSSIPSPNVPNLNSVSSYGVTPRTQQAEHKTEEESEDETEEEEAEQVQQDAAFLSLSATVTETRSSGFVQGKIGDTSKTLEQNKNAFAGFGSDDVPASVPAPASQSNNVSDGFSGFDAPSVAAVVPKVSNVSSSSYRAPEVFGTPSATIGASVRDTTSSFGWNDDKEEVGLFAATARGGGAVLDSGSPAQSSVAAASVVKPYAPEVQAPRAPVDSPVATSTKRRTRKKGSIKPSSASSKFTSGSTSLRSPVVGSAKASSNAFVGFGGSGTSSVSGQQTFVGFGGSSSSQSSATSTMESGTGSAFGFMNEQPVKSKQSDMFGSLGRAQADAPPSNPGDIFAALGRGNSSGGGGAGLGSAKKKETESSSAFGFMNEQPTQSSYQPVNNSGGDMFGTSSGGGGMNGIGTNPAQGNAQNTAQSKHDDPFAGLF